MKRFFKVLMVVLLLAITFLPFRSVLAEETQRSIAIGVSSGGSYTITGTLANNETGATNLVFSSETGDVTFVATPDNGYVFVGWYEGIMNNETHFVTDHTNTLLSSNATFATTVADSILIYALFEEETVNKSRVQVIMSESANNLGGTYTISGGGQDSTINHNSTISPLVPLNSSITLTVTPDEYHSFVGWYNAEEYDTSGDAHVGVMGWRPVTGQAALSTNATYTFTASSNYYNIMPVFNELYGHNNIWTTSGGEVTVLYENRKPTQSRLNGNSWGNGEVVEYLKGDPITLYARATTGYAFVGWFISDPLASNPDNYVQTPVISTDATFTYYPGITTVEGVDEPLNYLTAVFRSTSSVGQVTRVTVVDEFIASTTETEEVPYSTNLANYVNGKKWNINETDQTLNNRWLALFGETEGVYKYPKQSGLTWVFVGQSYQFVDNALIVSNHYQVKYDEVIVTKADPFTISSIDLSATLPFVGTQVTITDPMLDFQSPQAEIVIPTGEHYLLNGDGTTIPYMKYAVAGSNDLFVGAFEKNQEYDMYIWLSADENSFFAAQPTALVNGVAGEIVYRSDTTVCVRYTFTPQVRQTEYTLTDNGNAIIFTDDEGQTFTFSMIDLMTLTDEEIEELGGTREQVDEILEGVHGAVDNMGTLVGVFSILLQEGTTEIHTVNGGFKIRIKITDAMKNYNTFKLVYVSDTFATEDPIVLTKNGDYFEGVVPHLSGYALIGSNTPENNPNTYDAIYKFLTMLGVSILGMFSIGFYLNKKREN